MNVHELPTTGLKMECPFTWELDELVLNFCKNERTITNDEISPVMCFIDMITFAYIRFMQGKIVVAKELIEQINDLWGKIYESVSEQKVYSFDVLMHIKDATAYYIYSMIGLKEKAKEMESKIKDANDLKSDIEKGTKVGSRAIASGLFYEKSVDTCIELAKQASSYSPNCALWHYFTAKCLRIKRRYNNFSAMVSEEEKKEFLKCYELSQSLDYRICIARMYKESKNWKKCSEIFNEIYMQKPTRQKDRLILALSFINSKDFSKAKDCLDYIESTVPPEKRSKTYYHYLAKYYEANEDYPKAKENYIIATCKADNFPADIDYLNLIRKTSDVKKNYDVIKHLKSMIKKYKDKESFVLRMYLDLATTYLFQNKNLKLAADYFLMAIKMDPCDPQLENFQLPWKDKTKYNIFELISKATLVLPSVDSSCKLDNGIGDSGPQMSLTVKSSISLIVGFPIISIVAGASLLNETFSLKIENCHVVRCNFLDSCTVRTVRHNDRLHLLRGVRTGKALRSRKALVGGSSPDSRIDTSSRVNSRLQRPVDLATYARRDSRVHHSQSAHAMHSILRWYLLLALCSGLVRSVIEPEEDNEIPRESASSLKNASSAATEVGKNVRVNWNKSIVETYETAVQAYLEENWKGCVRGFDELAAKYRQLKSTLIDCRRQCRSELEQSFKPIWPENIEDLHFYERKIHETLCVLNCHQDYRELPGHKQALRRVPQKFEWKLVGGEYFAYLHVCYYQLDMLQEAANAAYSYLVWHADHQPSRAALAWYMQMPEVDNTTIRNLLAEDFVADYVAGVKAYESGYYEEAVVRLEAAVASYLEGEEQCRYYCEGSFEQSWNPDFVTSVSNHFVFDLNCKRRCSRLLNTIDGEYRDALLVQFFNYLQFAYYKLNEIGSACEAVATFLLFFPADETMLSNKAYYESLPTVRPEHFEPREELRKYFLRQEYEMRLLLLVEEKFSPIEERLIKLDKIQNQ
ncbi:unnamed protein product [Trichogramma brassicae]|uniref:Leprecan-like alpha-helical domain-containing protein n=1 Tax=Trichogramma brassicae TaxID=86971 RepID=A0A6H5HXE7_9HYME|nr:unnamed protein product [Trichogramma brassicae]